MSLRDSNPCLAGNVTETPLRNNSEFVGSNFCHPNVDTLETKIRKILSWMKVVEDKEAYCIREALLGATNESCGCYEGTRDLTPRLFLNAGNGPLLPGCGNLNYRVTYK